MNRRGLGRFLLICFMFSIIYAVPAFAESWLWPLDKQYQTVPDGGWFNAPRPNRLHKGLDIAAPLGVPVRAMKSGKLGKH